MYFLLTRIMYTIVVVYNSVLRAMTCRMYTVVEQDCSHIYTSVMPMGVDPLDN